MSTRNPHPASRQPTSSRLEWGQNNPKANITASIPRTVIVPICRPAGFGIIKPRTTTRDAELTGGDVDQVGYGPAGKGILPSVNAPFPNVPMHVEQPPLIRPPSSHRMCHRITIAAEPGVLIQLSRAFVLAIAKAGACPGPTSVLPFRLGG